LRINSFYIYAFFLLLLNCGKKETTIEIKRKTDTTISAKKGVSRQDPEEIQNTENFTDSLEIAAKGNYKIKIEQQTIDTLTKVRFTLFKKVKNSWIRKQRYALVKEVDFALDVQIKDFNNDGLNDFTISYAAAGNGSNDIRELFVFSKQNEAFIEIKNSGNYANLDYNKKLNCIYSLRIYGSGCTTTFLRIKKDTLQEFAAVAYENESKSAESYWVKNGKQIKIKSKKIESEDAYILFTNFNPIEE
jgi:hypothetical protein